MKGNEMPVIGLFAAMAVVMAGIGALGYFGGKRRQKIEEEAQRKEDERNRA